MDKRILLTMGLLPSVVYAAEANGLVVFVAIAGIPIAIAIIALVALITLPTKQKNKLENPEIGGSVTSNTKKGRLRTAISFTISAFIYLVTIYLCFIPTLIFPRSNAVLIINISIVGFIIFVKIISYLNSRKNVN